MPNYTWKRSLPGFIIRVGYAQAVRSTCKSDALPTTHAKALHAIRPGPSAGSEPDMFYFKFYFRLVFARISSIRSLWVSGAI